MIERIIEDRKTVQARAQQPATLFDVGRPTVEEQASNKGAVRTFIGGKGSESADYLTARIASDRPDIIARMKAGEYKSVRAAASDAGLVKKRVSMSLTLPVRRGRSGDIPTPRR